MNSFTRMVWLRRRRDDLPRSRRRRPFREERLLATSAARLFRKGRRLCIGILHQELPASAGGGTKLPRNRSVVDPPIYLFAAQTRRCSSARTLSTSRSSAVVSAAVTLTPSPTDGPHRLNTRQCTFSRLSSAHLAPHTDSTRPHAVSATRSSVPSFALAPTRLIGSAIASASARRLSAATSATSASADSSRNAPRA